METLAEDLSGGLQLEEWPRGREEEEDIEWSDSSGTEEDITTSAMDPWSLSLCNSCAPLAEGEEPPSTVEQVIYRCNPTQQEALRKEVLNVQYAVGFDAESIVRQYLRVGDSSQKTLHQCMVPVKPCSAEWLPSNMSEWMCSVCPEGTRRLVVASHKSTRVHSWSGKFLEEHESHLPGGSRSSISAVNEENDCTILDCMYLKEIQMYYVLDMLYWKGRSFYQVEARDRITTLHEKMNGIPTLGKIMQTNTRRFRLVPLSYTSDKESVCAAIASTQFAISGLMLCHKRSLYMRGVTPVALWVPVYLVQGVMEILISKRNINKLCGREWRRKEYTVRPKRVFDVQNAACIASCQTSWRHPSQYDAHPPWSFYGSYYVRHENCNNHKLTCPHIYYENYTLQPQERYNHHQPAAAAAALLGVEHGA
ncbi:uncharacterized protein LOC143282349 [Babylonia areolata]|uniref:uncharacterized protein LOC143282349 n=1 Tax=Babylonia areolata TaxID=304850 RepID=UPI003FD041B5